MAEKKEVEGAKDMVTLLNRGTKSYITKAGELAPGGSLALPASEAAFYLDYHGVFDASKIVAGVNQSVDILRKENAKLVKANAALHTDLDTANARIAELEAELASKDEKPKSEKGHEKKDGLDDALKGKGNK